MAAANVLNPQIQGILAANNAAGGAPYKPVGPMGSPFIMGGGQAYTPPTTPGLGGLSFGTLGQWALPRPAGVSLGYIPTPQVIGSSKNDFTPPAIDTFLPKDFGKKAAEPAKKSTDKKKKKDYNSKGSDRGSAGYTTSGGYGSRGAGSGSSSYGSSRNSGKTY